jgi:hypothetical protein
MLLESNQNLKIKNKGIDYLHFQPEVPRGCGASPFFYLHLPRMHEDLKSPCPWVL